MEPLSALNRTIPYVKNFHFIPQFLENMIWNYCYLNAGLTLAFNKQKYISQNGLLDLLRDKTKKDEESLRYPIIHLKGNDLENCPDARNQYGEEYYSFVNGQYTTPGWYSPGLSARSHR